MNEKIHTERSRSTEHGSTTGEEGGGGSCCCECGGGYGTIIVEGTKNIIFLAFFTLLFLFFAATINLSAFIIFFVLVLVLLFLGVIIKQIKSAAGNSPGSPKQPNPPVPVPRNTIWLEVLPKSIKPSKNFVIKWQASPNIAYVDLYYHQQGQSGLLSSMGKFRDAWGKIVSGWNRPFPSEHLGRRG
ncbi:hypothetical protein GWO43_16690, partial [candidate division KSB1 bacterium]|nr:hypothetical protein [candidate division KSB1 bacterium]NIS25585.1 hypothetical protein [candidate division KSB1 bacterium]NIT72480.1 hypothetical protein [candidate division KSB1 bacterium]NIU89689.1 hypothetical protein [candidate division KSB1 bacterium]NIW70619.1 hypothetical protein [candidate division KSB1 bacterium]